MKRNTKTLKTAQHTPGPAMRDRSDYWRERSTKRRQDLAYRKAQAALNKRWREQHGSTPDRLARKAEQMRGYRIAHAERHAARLAERASHVRNAVLSLRMAIMTTTASR